MRGITALKTDEEKYQSYGGFYCTMNTTREEREWVDMIKRKRINFSKPLIVVKYDAYTESRRILKEFQEYDRIVKGIVNERPKC